MDMLKRELAPLSTRVWEEIESRAAEILRSRLSARKAVHVVGPLGWNHTAVAEGRLDVVDESGDVKAGVYRVAPLSEARVRFSLNRWEMDNLNGAKGIDLDALDAAARRSPTSKRKHYTDSRQAASSDSLKQPRTSPSCLAMTELHQESVSVASSRSAPAMRKACAVVGTKAWLDDKEVQGIPLTERVERLIGGKVIHSLAIDGAYLIPYDDENLELTIGQDFAIGYESHDTKEVTLFLTESFTFRVLDPNLIVPFTV
jgi:uncharacterized linocin/CFP29 family protein